MNIQNQYQERSYRDEAQVKFQERRQREMLADMERRAQKSERKQRVTVVKTWTLSDGKRSVRFHKLEDGNLLVGKHVYGPETAREVWKKYTAQGFTRTL